MQINNDQFTVATARPDKGLVQPGSYTWTASPDYFVSLAPATDPQQCTVTCLGPIGECVITSNALTLTGETVSGFNLLQIVEPTPTSLIVEFSAPQNQ